MSTDTQQPEWTKSVRVPKFENTEVAATSSYTWEIDDWVSLQDRHVSPKFTCGGFEWEILLYPRGNPQRGCLSLYLNALGPVNGDKDASPKSWHVCAAFSLVMWNPDHSNVFVTQSSNHRFTPRISDWGYNEFTVLRSVFTRGQHAPAALISARGPQKQLGVNITVQIEVLEDPTGVLWHDFLDYDSREATGYTGLVNQGATCYLNSLLQSLFFTRAFRNAVYEIPDSSGVTGGLQRLFYKLATSHPAVDTTDLTRTFGWDSADAFTQHDVQELARVLMDRLESKMKNTKVDGFLTKLFVGQMKSYIKCINVPFESSRIEDFWDVQLNVRGMPDVYASFRDYCAAETLEGDNQYAAGEYGLQDAVKGVVFESLPPVLHLQLKRYDYDWMHDVEVKINDHYEYPLNLDLTEFVENKGDWQYELHGVLVHSGDLNAGHYYALIRPDAASKDWYKFDDDRVTKATLKEVLDENFGSNEGPLLRRVTSAYMLVYVRRDSSDFVFPTGDKDIKPPPEIAEKIEADRHAEEMRLQAIAEQQQYITLRVLFADAFKTHRGPGILPWANKPFDSIDVHEEPVNVKVRIGTRLTSLPRQLGGGSILLCPTPQTNNANARARSKKLHPIPLSDTYAVEQLAEWAAHQSPVVFVGPTAPADAQDMNLSLTDDHKLVFVKKYDGTGLQGSSVEYIDIKLPLSESLKVPSGFGVFLENSSPVYRKSERQVAPLDLALSAQEQGVDTSSILILAGINMGESLAEHFDQFANRITVRLIPLQEDDDASAAAASGADSASDDENNQNNSPSNAAGHVITASMKDDLSSLLKKVSESVNWSPEKIQLRSFPAQWQRSTPIQSNGANLSELWTHTYSNNVRVLYRRLPVPLTQFEQMRECSIVWLPEGYMGREEHKYALGNPEDLWKADINSNSANADDMKKIVIWASQYNRRPKELVNPTLDELVQYQSQSLDVYAAPLPEAEIKARATEGARLTSCYHFSKEVNLTHGIPFQFALVPEEKFETTKQRLFTLLRRNGDTDRSLDKIQFCVVREQSHEPLYITDDSLVLFDEVGAYDSIGLDHPGRRRFAFQQQAIHID